MMSRGLVRRMPVQEGFTYIAGEAAAPFISSLSEEYSVNLKERARWAVQQFADMPTDDIRRFTHQFFARWSSQFQSVQRLRDGA